MSSAEAIERDPLDPPYNCGGNGCRAEHDLPLYKPFQDCPDKVRQPARRMASAAWRAPREDPYSSSTYAPDPYEGEPADPRDGDWDWEG